MDFILPHGNDRKHGLKKLWYFIALVKQCSVSTQCGLIHCGHIASQLWVSIGSGWLVEWRQQPLPNRCWPDVRWTFLRNFNQSNYFQPEKYNWNIVSKMSAILFRPQWVKWVNIKSCTSFWWLSARLQYLHCISNGDTAVLHWAINLLAVDWVRLTGTRHEETKQRTNIVHNSWDILYVISMV